MQVETAQTAIYRLLNNVVPRRLSDREEKLGFISSTVAEYTEDGCVCSKEDAISFLQDANIDLDEEDLEKVAGLIELLTGGGEETATTEEDDFVVDDGSCEMCERVMRRTFHHLIPKEVHHRYMKKQKLPQNLVGSKVQCTTVGLNTYGTLICRQCHSAIHRTESNDVLAEKYNTVDLLLSHPQIYAFAKWNSKQRMKGI